MKTMQLNLPDSLEISAINMLRFLSAKLYESGKVSLGQAAEIAGLSKISFSEILSDYDVMLINYSAEDAINDAIKL